MKGSILIVDDEKDMLSLLKRIISEETDHDVDSENDPMRAIKLVMDKPYNLVITDLKMPKISGIQLLTEIKKIRPTLSVVILTAFATIETAVKAIKMGAFDYITKPFQRERILLTIDKVMEWQKIVAENTALRQALSEKEGTPSAIGSTPVMKRIFENIRQVAPSMATILITGESGTGKELAARSIHLNSMRSDKRMVTVNCTALSENVIESELFGHVKGAFTGAWKDKKGLVEMADKGTLFLDEIGDLSFSMQTKLLRLLQEGEYKPVGSEVTKTADIRFIAATNHNLKSEVKEKRFREDLFYRLNVVNIELPSLDERKQDIPLLSYYFLKKYALLNNKDIRDISPQAMRELLSHKYPGNVRELENIIERAIIFCKADALTTTDLCLEKEDDILFRELNQDILDMPFREAKEQMTQVFHARYIESILNESDGNISRAADKAGIQRQYLHRLMKDSGISAEKFKQKENAPKNNITI